MFVSFVAAEYVDIGISKSRSFDSAEVRFAQDDRSFFTMNLRDRTRRGRVCLLVNELLATRGLQACGDLRCLEGRLRSGQFSLAGRKLGGQQCEL